MGNWIVNTRIKICYDFCQTDNAPLHFFWPSWQGHPPSSICIVYPNVLWGDASNNTWKVVGNINAYRCAILIHVAIFIQIHANFFFDTVAANYRAVAGKTVQLICLRGNTKSMTRTDHSSFDVSMKSVVPALHISWPCGQGQPPSANCR
jgi:hypothetical protein